MQSIQFAAQIRHAFSRTEARHQQLVSLHSRHQVFALGMPQGSVQRQLQESGIDRSLHQG